MTVLRDSAGFNVKNMIRRCQDVAATYCDTPRSFSKFHSFSQDPEESERGSIRRQPARADCHGGQGRGVRPGSLGPAEGLCFSGGGQHPLQSEELHPRPEVVVVRPILLQAGGHRHQDVVPVQEEHIKEGGVFLYFAKSEKCSSEKTRSFTWHLEIAVWHIHACLILCM